MSDKIKDLLRWNLGAEGASKVSFSEVGLEASRAAGFAAFALALERRFGEDPTTETIQQFVARTRTSWVKPDALNPVLAEQVILAAYTDDDDLLDGVPAAELARVQLLLTYGVVRDMNITGDAFEAFLDEIVQLMNESGDEDD
ncbi:hypothetical protein LWF15_01165 [Kineosporia rhizophila]|uniref:hypothetical protein n=1 Tax=Kineosporia rhizophila TaxID=84633 RepID=UPI001E28A36F|nr:hypothetical protein [Kineosporia rhizophila]MCE0534113.1 hypothetical protein [Kineosporia rhizophila]